MVIIEEIVEYLIASNKGHCDVEEKCFEFNTSWKGRINP